MYAQDNNSLPVWIISSQAHHHISINSQPFLVGIVSKLEDFNSLLKYTDEDFIPHGHGNLSFYKENGDSVVKMMSPTPLQELINLRWYIQHLIHESG